MVNVNRKRVAVLKRATIAAFTLALALTLTSSAFAGDSGGKKNIVDTAVSAGQFNTLAKAIQAAGLAETLKGPGPFTVFAPTDEAFSKLPEGTVEDLLKPENKEKLTAILTYHVVPGDVTSSQVAGMNSAKTVNGESLSIMSQGGKVRVGDAQVVKTDIQASNGVIHVIDTVLMPQ
ncbi:MAG TPA: fasciclin domain-containing protein [Terriglobales bacterium]|nr:fasciclin domain-containing protein [Terriglobales bacterium]